MSRPHQCMSGSVSNVRLILPLVFILSGVIALALMRAESVSEPDEQSLASPDPEEGIFSDALEDGSAAPTMVIVRGGAFQMGDMSDEPNPDEQPVHQVTIEHTFALSRTEVTVQQFSVFVAATGYETDAERNLGGKGCVSEAHAGQGDWGWVEGRSWRDPGYEQSGEHPVVCVSWNDATEYASWLSGQTGHAYRLPTEAEWEYAARAGTLSRTSAGDEDATLCRVANIGDMTLERAYGRSPESGCDDGYARTAPVASFEANPFGLFDMHGNAWEWVADCWHDDYQGARADGGAWLKGGDCTRRVLRSGSWFNEPSLITSSYRDWDFSEDRYDGFGFRVARDLNPH